MKGKVKKKFELYDVEVQNHYNIEILITKVVIYQRSSKFNIIM